MKSYLDDIDIHQQSIFKQQEDDIRKDEQTDEIIKEKAEILERLHNLDSEERSIWGSIFALEMTAYSQNLRAFIIHLTNIAERLGVYSLERIGVGIEIKKTGAFLDGNWLIDNGYIVDSLNSSLEKRHKNEKEYTSKSVNQLKKRKLLRDFVHALIEALSQYPDFTSNYDLVAINNFTLELDPIFELRNSRVAHPGGKSPRRKDFMEEFGSFKKFVGIIQQFASIVTEMDYESYSTYDVKVGVDTILLNADEADVSIRLLVTQSDII